jgi:transcriptional regulator GlxA family with amidase domain
LTLLSSEATAVAEASSTQLRLIRTYLGRVRLQPATHRPPQPRGLTPVGRGTGPLDPVSGLALSRSLPASPDSARIPPAVRSAMAFIHDHAAEPIGLAEVAGAGRLSPRALQAAFRKHLGTTPLGYLRATRMGRVHADLQSARPGDGQTVSTIANRWGFSQLSRFAHDYKDRYGVSPRETLRRSGA